MSIVDESCFLAPIEANINTETKVEEQINNETTNIEKVEEQVIETIVEEPKVIEGQVIETIVEEPKVIEGQVIETIEEKIEEDTKFEEKIIGVEINIIEETLTTIILNIIKSFNEKKEESVNYFDKIGIQVNKETIDLIQKIIDNTPSILNDIEKSFIEVIKDNKIDTNDMPQFILIIQILYERIFNLKDFQLNPTKRSELSANILKFMVHVLVEERKIINDENKTEFLMQLDKLIESCISLLNFSHILDPPKVCCSIM
jgi:hypothetical protein